ncbi:MAG: methionyl-tRNA formyltransferase [Cyanobacteriota bacterium]|nr:methionyl-tRNA formyltransferase [Cyanobacteriota bacterium]
MKVLFWGTPAYAVVTLDALVAAGHELVGAVSQPDRRRGRGRDLVPSPVKARAIELGVPVFTPGRIRREPEIQGQLAELGADLSVVVAFGQILPTEVLDQPPLGSWNGHGSLLPRWRGAAPIQWALMEGDRETGVGIMAMEEGLDTGPVLLERGLPIGLRDNAHDLAARLAALTGELFVEALPQIAAAGPGSRSERWARLALAPQGEEGVRLARPIAKEDFRIDWSRRALELHRQVMGLYPGAVTSRGDVRLKLRATEPLVQRLAPELSPEAALLAARHATATDTGTGGVAAGTVLEVVEGVGLVVATGGCPLLLREAQLEGKGPTSGQAMVQQLGWRAGDRLGP